MNFIYNLNSFFIRGFDFSILKTGVNIALFMMLALPILSAFIIALEFVIKTMKKNVDFYNVFTWLINNLSIIFLIFLFLFQFLLLKIAETTNMTVDISNMLFMVIGCFVIITMNEYHKEFDT